MMLAAVIFFGKTVFATAALLTITPTSVQPDLLPGTSSSGSFQVFNRGTSSFRAKLYTAPYSVKGEDYRPSFTAFLGSPNVASWLKLSTAEASVLAGQALVVDYTLSVPAGTLPGGYYGAVIVNGSLPKPKNGIAVSQQVDEIFYITVAGPVNVAGKLVSWSSPFLQKSPLSATLRLSNSGSLHYFSAIHITVNNIFGGVEYSLTANAAILPQTTRAIPISWTGSPALGLFRVRGTATILNKTVTLPTRYVLVVSLGIRIIFIVILAVIVLLIIIWAIYRWLNPKRRKSARRHQP
jgi:hypothetical protein